MGDESLRILCVDDEQNVLHALKRLFLDEPYEVLTAGSGAEGLALLEARSPVRVVLSDYRMPVMNGVEFLRAVRLRWPETVRIVLSGYADTGAVVAAINEGQVYRFIPKPWNDDELRMTIAKAFEHYALQLQNVQLSEELKKTNGELRSLAAQQSCWSALASLPLAVVTVDRQGAVHYANEKAKLLFPRLDGAAKAQRSEIFSAELNAFIDGVLERNAPARAAVTVSGRRAAVHAGVSNGPGERRVTLVVYEGPCHGEGGPHDGTC